MRRDGRRRTPRQSGVARAAGGRRRRGPRPRSRRALSRRSRRAAPRSSMTSAAAPARWVVGWRRCWPGRSTGSFTTATPTCCAGRRRCPGPAADGAAVTVEARTPDLDRMERARPRRRDADHRVGAARHAHRRGAGPAGRPLPGSGCPILLTLSVIGRRRDRARPAGPPRRRRLRRASTADDGARALLGPDAVDFAAQRVPPARRRGPRLPQSLATRRPPDSALAAEWFTGWVGAAREQEPELSAECDPYARRRLEQASAGDLAVTVGHADLRPPRRAPR